MCFCILVYHISFFFFFPTLCLSSVTKGRKRICDLGEQGRDREKMKKLIMG